MNTIYKYPLQLGINNLALPMGAQILTAQLQGETIMLWALVDAEETRLFRSRTIEVVGTGFKMNDEPRIYIATAQTPESFVWHIFELTTRQ